MMKKHENEDSQMFLKLTHFFGLSKNCPDIWGGEHYHIMWTGENNDWWLLNIFYPYIPYPYEASVDFQSKE